MDRLKVQRIAALPEVKYMLRHFLFSVLLGLYSNGSFHKMGAGLPFSTRILDRIFLLEKILDFL